MNTINNRKRYFPAIPSFFEELPRHPFFNWGNTNADEETVPSVNIRETKDNFEVEMAAPGMEKKDFQIELDGNRLTISSEKEYSEEDKEEGYSRREFSYRSFQRSMMLPKDVVDEDKIQASYKNGLLHITIPKRENAKQRSAKRIEVS